MKNTQCGICGGEAVLISEEREVRIGKRSAVVEDQFFRCSACGEELYEPGQMDAVMLKASNAIREDLGLMMPEEIKSLRESLELSQAEFERLIGVGRKTVVRWERGTVFQNQATDALLCALRDVPGLTAYFSARTGVAVPMPGWQALLAAFDEMAPSALPSVGLPLFDLHGDELLERDQFTEDRVSAYNVQTGWFGKEAA